MAALLHDIGHSPFSHTLENVSKNFLPETTILITSEKDDKSKKDYLKILDIDLIKNITIMNILEKIYQNRSCLVSNQVKQRRYAYKNSTFGERSQ